MSEFAVTVEEIAQVWEHPNADLLELASLNRLNFQFVVRKGIYKSGDKVVYFPVDSLLPDWIITKMGLEGRLSGKAKNRVKTVKLRGQISQGLVIKPIELDEQLENVRLYADLTESLGVTKYDPPPILEGKAELYPLPNGYSEYDIQSAQRFVDIVSELQTKDIPLCVTEKVEGSNWGMFFTDIDTFDICQRTKKIVTEEPNRHTWVKMGYKLLPQLQDLIRDISVVKFNDNQLLHTIAFRGELAGPGIRKNIYGLKEHHVFLFDIQINGIYMLPNEFHMYCNKYGLETVPVIHKDITISELLANGETLVDVSNGKSTLGKNPLREGIVFKPTVPFWINSHPNDRVILKIRSPQYLAKSNL